MKNLLILTALLCFNATAQYNLDTPAQKPPMTLLDYELLKETYWTQAGKTLGRSIKEDFSANTLRISDLTIEYKGDKYSCYGAKGGIFCDKK